MSTKKLTTIAHAYAGIARGIDNLMDAHPPYWTERWLLKLVRSICTRRLRELVLILPDEEAEKLLR